MNKKDRAQLAQADLLIGNAQALIKAVGRKEAVAFIMKGKHPTLREAVLDLESARVRIRQMLTPEGTP